MSTERDEPFFRTDEGEETRDVRDALTELGRYMRDDGACRCCARPISETHDDLCPFGVVAMYVALTYEASSVGGRDGFESQSTACANPAGDVSLLGVAAPLGEQGQRQPSGGEAGGEPRMTEVAWSEGDALRMKFEGGGLHFLFDEAAKIVEDNYLSVRGKSKATGEDFEIVIQKLAPGTVTPAEKAAALTREIAELRAAAPTPTPECSAHEAWKVARDAIARTRRTPA